MVDIIPKRIRKFPSLYQIAFYVSLGLALLALLALTGLFLLENGAAKKVQQLENQIAEVGTREEKIQEAQLIADKKRIEDFANLLADRRKNSAVFKIIEEAALPKVWFTDFSLNDLEVGLTGQTPNFEILGQQLLVFRGQELIEKTTLEDLAIGKEGEVTFGITLSLKSEAFK